MYITQERVRDLFYYDGGTGEIFWRLLDHPTFPGWNKRYAGKVAGSMSGGYRTIRIDGVLYKAHRLIWLYVHGKWPTDEIDHINGNPSDNRILNLREATRVENSKNAKRKSNNKSGVQGVLWHPVARKWMAYIMVKGRQNYLGLFDDLGEAKARRVLAERQFNFHKNHGRAA